MHTIGTLSIYTRTLHGVPENTNLAESMQAELGAKIQADILSDNSKSKARGAYLAICLEVYETYQQSQPERWNEAVNALQGFDQVVQVLFHHSPVPAAAPLREKARAAGISAPAEKRELW